VRITNTSGISLPLAVWLAHDEYDYIQGVENYISVTTLMKPLRQIILPSRIPTQEVELDVQDMIATSMGHALHDSIEKAWKRGYKRALKLLGHPEELIERVAINPTDEERRASNHMIPVYIEQRSMREIDGYTIGGKFDMVTEGIVNDNKSTSVWAWINGTRDDEHRLQMSLYRWLDAGQPVRKITEDFGQINYIFTDWSKAQARTNPKYPKRVETKNIALMSLQDTENWIRRRIAEIETNKHLHETQLPECTDEELWRSAPQFKYYADAAKANTPGARSTKNFDSLNEARKFMAEKGGVGTIKTIPGEVKRCGYCQAFDICSQKDKYL
jgi:hypothetical protein